MRWKMAPPFRPTATTSRSSYPDLLIALAFTSRSLAVKGLSALRRIQRSAVRRGLLTAERLHSSAANESAIPFTPCPPSAERQRFSIPTQANFKNTSDMHLPFLGH